MYTIAPDGLSVSDTRFICSGQNDQDAFLAAINALPAAGGMLTLLPGIYHLTAPLELTSKAIVLQGSGMRSTQLEFGFSANDGCIKLGGEPNLPAIAIRDLAIVGDSFTTDYGIVLRNHANKHAFANLRIENMVAAGVRGENINSQCVFNNVQVWKSLGYGFQMYGVANRYIACHAAGDTGTMAGFRSQESGSTYVGCTIDGHAVGFELAGYAQGVSIHGLHAEQCGQGILVRAASPDQPRGVAFYGGMVFASQDPEVAAIQIARTDGVTISGLMVRNSASGKSISIAEPVTNCVLLNNRCEDATAYDVHPNADVTVIR